MRSISLIDETKKLRPPRGALEAMAKALSIQIERDFAPAWGIEPVQVHVGGRGEKIHFFDDPIEAEYLGYHSLDPKGRPYAHVYVSPAIDAGSGWLEGAESVAASASHEALEMLCDPTAMSFSLNGKQTLWAREVSDPVSADCYGIVAKGKRVQVSDFVIPAFFNPFSSGPFDHLELLSESFSLTSGGYAVCERKSRDYEKDRPRFAVKYDKDTPNWRRRQKRKGFGRTYWRLLLHA